MLGGGEGGQVTEEVEVEEGDQQQMKGSVAECKSDAVRGHPVNTTESNVDIDVEPEESLGECEPVGLTIDRHLSDGNKNAGFSVNFSSID